MKRISLAICLLFFTNLTIANAKNTTYTGTLKGYTAAWGFKTAKVIVEDAVTGIEETYLINIDSTGRFTANFPLSIDKECWVSFPFYNSAVYFLAGKTVTQHFSFSPTWEVSSVFEGDGSVVNNDINKIRPFVWNDNWDRISSDIYQYTPEQYKAYFLAMGERKIASIDSVAKTAKLSKTAYDLAADNVKYNTAEVLCTYNYHIESAYRIHNKVSFENKAPRLKEVKLEPAYYDFLKKIKYNRTSALSAYNYNLFLKRLKLLSLIYDKAGRSDYTREIKILTQLDTMEQSNKMTLQHYRMLMANDATAPGTMDKARPDVLKSLINQDISLELKLMSLQDTCQIIDDNKVPMTDVALARLKSKLNNDFLFEPILRLNNNVKKAIETSKLQTGYVSNNTPKVALDSVFDNIVSKYKGKAIFVDFWATWCGPCLQGMEDMKSVKSDLQGQNVVFVYITNPTSPETTYNVMIPDIKGEHYRITADEYNVISERFKINGIPHYTIIDTKGKVISNGAHGVNAEQLKAQLLQLAKE
jgi:thiol-disulfide isomerase/thioredoxin